MSSKELTTVESIKTGVKLTLSSGKASLVGGFKQLAFWYASINRVVFQSSEGRNTLALSTVLLLYCVSFTGSLNQLFTYLFHEDIYAFNSTYLETASSDALKTLEVVAAIKAVLELLQSLSGGVSFIVDVDVQLGESLSVLREITDNAWTVSLGSVGAANALTLVHGAIYSVMQPLLISLFLLLGLYLGFKNLLPSLASRIKRLIKPCLFLVVFTHLIVPLSIFATGKISYDYLQTQKQDLHSKLSDFNSSLPQHSSTSDLKQQVADLSKHFEGGLLNHIGSTGDYSLMAIKHILFNSTEFIFLPLIFILLSSIVLFVLLRRKPHLLPSTESSSQQ